MGSYQLWKANIHKPWIHPWIQVYVHTHAHTHTCTKCSILTGTTQVQLLHLWVKSTTSTPDNSSLCMKAEASSCTSCIILFYGCASLWLADFIMYSYISSTQGPTHPRIWSHYSLFFSLLHIPKIYCHIETKLQLSLPFGCAVNVCIKW